MDVFCFFLVAERRRKSYFHFLRIISSNTHPDDATDTASSNVVLYSPRIVHSWPCSWDHNIHWSKRPLFPIKTNIFLFFGCGNHNDLSTHLLTMYSTHTADQFIAKATKWFYFARFSAESGGPRAIYRTMRESISCIMCQLSKWNFIAVPIMEVQFVLSAPKIPCQVPI